MKNKLTDKKVNSLLHDIWTGKKGKSKLDIAIEKISKYKNNKSKNKFICKTFGICPGQVITPESFVMAIVKALEMK